MCTNIELGWTAYEFARRYWKEPYFKALDSIRAIADKHGLTMAEVALRWVSNHSLMKREQGDAILIGASSLNHIQQVITLCRVTCVSYLLIIFLELG